MKPEPLKRKFSGDVIHPRFTETDTDIYYLKDDIKSAVAWFKNMFDTKETMFDYPFIMRQIDKAFEDVVNKE